MEKRFFGNTPFGELHLYSLKNEYLSLSFTELGAAITSLFAFGKRVVYGYETAEEYVTGRANQGAVIGRVANRIANCSFTMNGINYSLPDNNGGSTLHGGIRGFSRRRWRVVSSTLDSAELEYISEDGEEGFPSRLTARVRYSLVGSALRIDFSAIPEGDTPIALTSHPYFNLEGDGELKEHMLKLYADRYTEVDSKLIPTGNRNATAGTRFDFSSPKCLGDAIELTGTYDVNFLLSKLGGERFSLPLAAEVFSKELEMRVYTDYPCLQLYTAPLLSLDKEKRKKDGKSRYFCLEAQFEPNAVNRGECFFSEGEEYRQTTIYDFSLKNTENKG